MNTSHQKQELDLDDLSIHAELAGELLENFNLSEITPPSKYVFISVVIPTYNIEKYIAETIQSILDQTFQLKFELILVDDGSTDNTVQVIESFHDDRIRLIKKEHGGIADTSNVGISNARGEYIALLDGDDKSYPDRLKIQYNWMQDHPDVGVLGTGFVRSSGPSWGYNGQVTKSDLAKGCMLCNPSVMIRADSLKHLEKVYEKTYLFAQDYHLWFKLINYGVKIYNISDKLCWYRVHDNQATHQFGDIQTRAAESIKQRYTDKITCIIVFKNEGIEIENTCASIRKTTDSNKVSILLIDDTSDDGVDYISVAEKYNCQYYKNGINLGSCGSKHIGVKLCDTEYFVLLDGHMRFYDQHWEDKLLSMLQENLNSIITSNTVYITNKDGILENDNLEKSPDSFSSVAACINFADPGNEFTAKWTNKKVSDKELIPVACVLGAVYASNKTHWQKINGLWGLKTWGMEEPLMSLKTWLSGGSCLLLQYWGVGHVYRGVNPNPPPTWTQVYNSLLLIYLFSPEEKLYEYFKNQENKSGYDKALEEFGKNKVKIDEHKNYLKSIFTRTLNDFNNIINNQVS
jgi:glycosyltransferase involved in cell wall biosynthesis